MGEWEMPPVDGKPGYVWPSWREALVDAFKGVDWAYERRRRVVQAAFDAGLSLRQIGEAVGMSPAGVHKIIGKQRHKPNAALDAPAFASSPASAETPEQEGESQP